MSISPGHGPSPDHRISETLAGQRMLAELDGNVIADSADVVRVDERGHPTRYYFSRTDVCMDRLRLSGTSTECPPKGRADYYDVVLGDTVLRDAAWSYESPCVEHERLRGRIAFHDEKFPELQIVFAER